jgi:hypothetical protein
MKHPLLSLFLLFYPLLLTAQVGSHRNEFAVGVNGGYVLSNVGFVPKVTQTFHGGMTGGVSFRYISEKYFQTLCSIHAEINYVQAGWKEDIVNLQNEPVLNKNTGLAEEYSSTINYIQVPVFAHLAWGKEQRGFQFFFQAGPQFGYMLNENTQINFELNQANVQDRANTETTQYKMPVEHKFDYGIVAGIGVEYSLPKVGHLLLDARYYYGLGNLYGDTKRDYFARSNLSNIQLRLSYLFDITTTTK